MKNSNLKFTVKDIVNLPSLMAKLITLANTAIQYIASRLSEKTRRLLTAEPDDNSVTADLSATLADDLDAMITGPAIYDEQRFADVPMSAKLRKRIRKELAKDCIDQANRLALEAALGIDVVQRLTNKRVQNWIKLKGGLRRLEGETWVQGRIKIDGKEHTKTFKDEADGRDNFHAWVAGLRKSTKQARTAKESLAHFVEPYLTSRAPEVLLKTIKAGRIPALRRTYEDIGRHWLGFRTFSLSKLTPKAMAGIVKYLLLHAKNLVQPGKTIRPATYNVYVSALALLLGYIKKVGKISAEQYYTLLDEIKYANLEPRKVKMPTASQLKCMRARLYRSRAGKCNGELGPKFDAYMLTGQRKATVNAMMVEHFNFETGDVYLTNLKGHAGEPSEAWMPMVEEFADIMQRYIKERGLKEGECLWTTSNNNGAFRRAAQAAGLITWYHHACRYWFATIGLQQTHDPLAMADLMCHRDDAKTLLKVYRQVCTEHLRGTTSGLIMYGKITAGNNLTVVTARTEKILKRILGSTQTAVIRAVECILWIESKLDARDYAALDQLPTLAQDNLPICPPASVRVADGPNPTLIKQNLKYLIRQKNVYHNDVAAATGIKRSAIDAAARCGDLQSRYLPKLCGYFDVTIDEFLNCDLSAPVSNGNQPPVTGSNEALPALVQDATGNGVPRATVGELISRQDQAAFLKVVARNLRSMLFETNLSVNGLAQKADMEHSNIARFLSEKFIPTDATILKLATALCVNETAIVDPNCENVVINPIFVIGNLKAIIEHSGMATSTYIVRHLKLDDRNMQKVLLNGNITSTQAHRIVEAEGGAFSLRQLVCEDLTAKFPPAPKLDAAVVQRNLCSVGWERGLYSAEIARKSGISFTTAMNYAAGRSKRIGRPLLTKIADSLEMPVAELVDPLRPVTELTPFFKSNVQFLLDQSGLAPTAFAEQCSLELRALRLLIDGSDPNPHQVAKLCANLKRTPLEVLTKDLRASTKTGTDGGPEVAPVSAPDPNNQ